MHSFKRRLFSLKKKVDVLNIPSPKLSSAVPKGHVWGAERKPNATLLRNKIFQDFLRIFARTKPVHTAPRISLVV